MKINNTGFTLIELIATISILALIIVIMLPTINTATEKMEKSIKDNKISSLVTSAERYGEDYINNYQICKNSLTSNELQNSCTISIHTLIDKNYSSEDEINDNSILNGNILLCYDEDLIQINAYYYEYNKTNYSCN